MQYRLLKKSLISALLLMAVQSYSQSLTPLVIGTIKPGDSVVIYYDVTINSGAGAAVSNQGAVSGANFTSFNTDDPATAAASDPTITQLNMFPLPVMIVEFSAASRLSGIQLSWKVREEDNMATYEVERSTDGRTFMKIGDVAARNLSTPSTYSFFDQSPGSGVNYYRLRLVELNSSAKYTLIVRVDAAAVKSSVRIYPNPVAGQYVTLQLNNMQTGSYELLFYNNIGQVAFRQTIHHSSGSTTRNVSLPVHLKGIYSVQLRSDQQLFSQMLMIQ